MRIIENGRNTENLEKYYEKLEETLGYWKKYWDIGRNIGILE